MGLGRGEKGVEWWGCLGAESRLAWEGEAVLLIALVFFLKDFSVVILFDSFG